MRILIVTGLSGAGKSVALRTLEDIGFEAIDNLPLSMIPTLVSSGYTESQLLAIGEDARSRDFSFERFQEVITKLKASGNKVDVMFLDCDPRVLQLRFTETRRKHPMAQDRPVIDGIRYEREMLYDIRNIADIVFDTSEWNNTDLRNAIRSYYGEDPKTLSVFVNSFSFKRGVPRDADIVFDVRFLKNPFYDEKLREKTGQESEVKQFIEADPDESKFFSNMTQLVEPLLPRYLKEGKSYLTIAIGCTGGQHRSVFMAEKLAGFLKQKEYKVGVRHRDLDIALLKKSN